MKTCVYTTFFPSFERFIPDFILSLLKQDDTEFELVIALDGLSSDPFLPYQSDLKMSFINIPSGFSPAQVREYAWMQIINDYDALIFCDGDDVFSKKRVSNAKNSLKDFDLDACSLSLVNNTLEPLNVFMYATDMVPNNIHKYNIFGLSNTGYKTNILKNTLPIPKHVIAVDWFIAHKAIQMGASCNLREDIDCFYRQHGKNIASPSKPATQKNVLQAAKISRIHLENIIKTLATDNPDILTCQKRLDDVILFEKTMAVNPDLLYKYLQLFNSIETETLWWNTVAKPTLDHLWKAQ